MAATTFHLARRGIAGFAALALIASSATAQTLRPLVTEDVATIGDGQLEVQVATEFIEEFQSPSSELSGRLLRLPVVGFNYGLGDRAEIQLRAPLRQFFTPDALSRRSASGDATIATKLRLAGGHGIWPGLGARAIVKLPNVSNESGIGTDETDVTIELLAGMQLGEATIATSAGIAILGDPTATASQNDKLVFGVGFLLPMGPIEIGADFHGLRFGDSGGADEWTALGALATRVGRVRLDGAGGVASRNGLRSLMLTFGAGMTFEL